jgi:hypothetical protein
MFEFLMLIGFLGAGLCHWQPRAEIESAEPKERKKKDGEAKVRERRQVRKALRTRISTA